MGRGRAGSIGGARGWSTRSGTRRLRARGLQPARGEGRSWVATGHGKQSHALWLDRWPVGWSGWFITLGDYSPHIFSAKGDGDLPSQPTTPRAVRPTRPDSILLPTSTYTAWPYQTSSLPLLSLSSPPTLYNSICSIFSAFNFEWDRSPMTSPGSWQMPCVLPPTTTYLWRIRHVTILFHATHLHLLTVGFKTRTML
jgi:hypothetical protein